jgi:hypothetical protein
MTFLLQTDIPRLGSSSGSLGPTRTAVCGPRASFVIAAVVVVLAYAGSAQGSSKQFVSSPRVDQIASAVAGMSLEVLGEDDWGEWADLIYPDDPRIMGFVSIYDPPSSPFYRRILVSPDYWAALEGAAINGPDRSGFDRYTTAVAIFTLTHEAYHFRLLSADEGLVNACALRAFPDVLKTQFGLWPTTTRTGTRSVRVRVRARVRVRRRWVTRYRWKTSHRDVTTTVPNPAYTELVADVEDFYRRQPPSYNSGACVVTS